MSKKSKTPTIVLPTSEAFSLSHYWLMILHRKWTILLFTLLCTVLAIGVTLKLTPIYQASTTVLLENNKSNVLSIEEVVGLNTNKEYFLTEFEILKSMELSERVVRRLNLDVHPLYDPRQQPEKLNIVGSVRDFLGLSEPKSEPTDQEYFDRTLELFRNGLSVSLVRQTQLVKISYQSPDANLAAEIADAMADIYIESHLQGKLDVTKKATEWLNSQLGDLRAGLQSSEEALQQFREEVRFSRYRRR